MANLPITHMTLYKHGVGYFERRAQMNGEQIDFRFRSGEMNDILKSLTVIDSGSGKVMGVDYTTPRKREELLQGCSVILDHGSSLQDLLASLRGRRVKLQMSQDEYLAGTLVGVDIPKGNRPVSEALVSVLQDDSRRVGVVGIGGIQDIEIMDERGEKDLRFFLDTEREQENNSNISIRLTPGEHSIVMSYVAPAPTWRISYRIVLENGRKGSDPKALLLGWGIFDNLLEEDLNGVSISLVAGMPISFVYDLATPFTPERPVVKEEARVAAAPVEFDQAVAGESVMFDIEEDYMDLNLADTEEATTQLSEKMAAYKSSTTLSVKSKSMDELFKYDVQNSVTVNRGQSAMVPVISSDLEYKKDLLYNSSKMARHPVATLRLNNTTGLTIERGPVTVIDDGEYVGEAVVPFTREEGEIVVPYAVELGVKVNEESFHRTEENAVGIKAFYLLIDQWNIYSKKYRVFNSTARPVKVLVEHARRTDRWLIETDHPAETTEGYYRFEVTVEPHSEKILSVHEKALTKHKELFKNLEPSAVENYFQKGLIGNENREEMLQVLSVVAQIGDLNERLKSLEAEKKDVYKSQKQIQSNMAPLSQTGDEGAMRKEYLQKLKTSEKKLDEIDKRYEELIGALKQSKNEVGTRLRDLEKSMPLKKE